MPAVFKAFRSFAIGLLDPHAHHGIILTVAGSGEEADPAPPFVIEVTP
jgi:hypothetical protein